MKRTLIIIVVIISLFAQGVFIFIPKVEAATLTSGSALLSDGRFSATAVSYTLTFSNITLSAIKCIKVAFSTAVTAGSKPPGMTITSATFSGTYIPTPASWTVTNTDATGITTITFATGETPAGATGRTVILSGITNGSTAGTNYFIQFSTFNNVDCATTPVDNGVVAYIYTTGQTVTATIDPTLTFSIAGVASGQTVNGATANITTTTTTIPFGTVTSATNKIGAQDLVVATNAGSGYTVTTKYTGALTSTGGNPINDWTGTNAAPTAFSAAGTESFGYTTADATLGTGTAARFSSNKWAGFTTSPLEVAYSAVPVSETVRVGYQLGISTTTNAGSYTTTVIFTVTPIY